MHVQGPADNLTEITLKWSCENGAEQYPLDTKPDDFNKGQWIYEFYNDTSEKHLGVHLALGFSPLRWKLSDKVEKPDSIKVDDKVEEPAYVRRWDGYCVLSRNGLNWNDPKQEGVQLTDGVLTVVIKDVLEMTLDLKDKCFAAGDYWLAVVREQATPQIEVLSEQPLGVTHHYLRLAPYKNGKIQTDSLEVRQQLSFPALTDLIADRVPYDASDASSQGSWGELASWWEKIKGSSEQLPDTLQEALDKTSKYLEYVAQSTVIPPGTVMAFASEIVPSGWLECDGRSYGRDDNDEFHKAFPSLAAYPELFNAIGVAFGTGDGKLTFNVPDLRGVFIRGWDHDLVNEKRTPADPDRGKRLQQSGSIGNRVGSYQDDSFETHIELTH